MKNMKIMKNNKVKKISFDEFLKRVLLAYPDRKFDFSLSEFKNMETKIKIICQEGHIIFTTPHTFLKARGTGCLECFHNSIKRTKDDLYTKLYSIFGNEYDLSKIDYKNKRTPIVLICKIHGDFKKFVHHLFNGHGCPACDKEKRRLFYQNLFIEQAKIIHYNKYNYSLVNHQALKKKVIIICPIHGKFNQSFDNHVVQKQGCPKCCKRISSQEISWLNSLNIAEECRQKSIKVFDGNRYINYIVDAYDLNTNIVYEFNGDYYHGNPDVFNHNNFNKVCEKTFGELYKNTIRKEENLVKSGYKVISMWENDWKKIQKEKK